MLQFQAEDSLEAMLKTGAIEDEQPIRILHISDPHFTGSRYPTLRHWAASCLGIHGHAMDVWDAVPHTVENLENPDLIIISGDLTTFGTPRSLRHARGLVTDLANSFSVPLERVFVVPGNHDRFLGYLGHLFRPWLDRFEDVFGDLFRKSLVEVRGRKVLIFPFDSTEEGFRLWPFFANTGRVSRRQFNIFNETVQSSEFKMADVVIAILHHHPLPVPDIDLEGLTVMKNGGAFMAHMQRREVDLVLHGHMHYGYSCRINYSEASNDTVIVASGTACQRGSEVCSFSVIDFHPGRRVAIKVYTHNQAGFMLDSNRARAYRLTV